MLNITKKLSKTDLKYFIPRTKHQTFSSFHLRFPNSPSKVALIFSASNVINVDLTSDAPKINATFEGIFGVLTKNDKITPELPCKSQYRGENKGLYVVARILFLLLLNCSAWPCMVPA